MYSDRLSKLQAELGARQISCLALIPGANLHYMSGLDFHLMERPTVLFIPASGSPVFALPSLEMPKFDTGGPFDINLFPYTDEEGPAEAFRKAMNALPEIHSLAVEHLGMRVLELKLVQRHAPNAILHDANPVMDTLRLYKAFSEIDLMQQAIRISEQALEDVISKVKPGMTEREIASMLTIAQIKGGGENVPFDPIVLAGARAALPHGGITDSPIREGDVLLIDFGTRKGGYVSDITRTFVVGKELDGTQRDVYEAVKAANAAGFAAGAPGVPCEEVDRAARKIIEDAGFGEYFIHRTGHGVGLDGHERPYIVEGNKTLLEAGMTFTIEPGIYIPGEIGVRIEDNVVVTENGLESLSTFNRDLRVIG